MLAAERQRAFLGKFHMLEAMRTQAGAVALPQVPKTWGKAETITIGYGHGLAVAPLQFAAAMAALVNGGQKIAPTFLAATTADRRGARLIAAATSAKVREIMRLNVTNPAGTGWRAHAQGYRVGGKTGTAEMPAGGGYREKSVIASFLGAFPMDGPRFLTLVVLFEPQRGDGGSAEFTAGLNAAPVTGKIVEAIAPLLGVLPRLVEPSWPQASLFDAPSAAQ